MVKMMWLASARNEFMRMLNPDSAHGLASHSQSRDPSCGGGHFLARLLRRHAENTEGMDPRTRLEDTTRLLKGIQGLDIHPTMVDAARRRLLLEAERYGLLNSDLGLTPERVRNILNESIRCADALQESWPWIEAPACDVLQSTMVANQGQVPRSP